MGIEIHLCFNEPDTTFRQSVDAGVLKQNEIDLIFKVGQFIQRLNQNKSVRVCSTSIEIIQ